MMRPVDGYELIDAGGGARLERFGEHVTDRPHGGAYGERRAPERWAEADLRFDRDGGWSGPGLAEAGEGWPATIGGLDMGLRPTDAGQVGCFPEHAAMLPWLRERVELRRATAPDAAAAVRVLHLFAYTGLATLAVAAAGGRVAHVDAARPAVAWARRNAAANGLDGRPDPLARRRRPGLRRARAPAGQPLRRDRARSADLRARRVRTGRGGWTTDLDPLLADCRAILAPDGFLLLTAHTEHVGEDQLAGRLGLALRRAAGDLETGDLRLDATSGASLGLGVFARWDGAR